MVYTLISDGPLAPNLGPPTGRGRVGAVAAQAIDGSTDRWVEKRWRLKRLKKNSFFPMKT